MSDLIRPLEKYLYQIRALMTEGKDIHEAIARAEFPLAEGERGKSAGGLLELANLLSQSVADLEQLVNKI